MNDLTFRTEYYITGPDEVRLHVIYSKEVRELLQYPPNASEADREKLKRQRVGEIMKDILVEVKKEVKDIDITAAGSTKTKVQTT